MDWTCTPITDTHGPEQLCDLYGRYLPAKTNLLLDPGVDRSTYEAMQPSKYAGLVCTVVDGADLGHLLA